MAMSDLIGVERILEIEFKSRVRLMRFMESSKAGVDRMEWYVEPRSASNGG